MTDKNKLTTWQKGGPSPNASGRPRGSSNKSLSMNQLNELLGKGDKAALETVRAIMVSSNNENARLKAALAWLGFHIDTEKVINKRIIDNKTLEIKKDAEGNTRVDDDDDDIPVVSLTAIK